MLLARPYQWGVPRVPRDCASALAMAAAAAGLCAGAAVRALAVAGLVVVAPCWSSHVWDTRLHLEVLGQRFEQQRQRLLDLKAAQAATAAAAAH